MGKVKRTNNNQLIMNQNTLMTYSLLSHLKETSNSKHSSIVEIFFPIVKKAIVEYAKEKGCYDVKGKNITEIQSKISGYFGLDLPISVLDFILSQISIEIADERVFAYFNDKGFIINSFVFNEIDDEINSEYENLKLLGSDFEDFCNLNNSISDFDELIRFVVSQKIDLFADRNDEDLDFNYIIPKYISSKFNDSKIFKILSDIYLGSLISSYLEFNIKKPVSKSELLVDTNFFISLINLNTEEANSTCNQLFDLCKKMGFKFSILFSTIEQIKVLLSTRIQDFASKGIGLTNEADVFGACIRRNLDKTQLERIKDSIDSLIQKFGIDIIYETRIKDLIQKAKKSEKYKELLVIRKQQRLSALNDTIAYFYVQSKRGVNIKEFSDVRCWFLNNSYHKDYYTGIGYKLHERFKISANELLSLLWLSNPSQDSINVRTLAKGGLSTYIAKYKKNKTPSIKIIKDINYRAKKALDAGEIEEKDVYAISIRMAEGQLSNGEATELAESPDEEFITTVKEYSRQDEEILGKLKSQQDTIENQTELLNKLVEDNIYQKFQIAKKDYEIKKDKALEIDFIKKSIKMNNVAWSYLFFIVILIFLWFINYEYTTIINPNLATGIAFLLFFISVFLRFVEHKTVLKCLKFTFLARNRVLIKNDIIKNLEKSYIIKNPEPILDDFKGKP